VRLKSGRGLLGAPRKKGRSWSPHRGRRRLTKREKEDLRIKRDPGLDIRKGLLIRKASPGKISRIKRG